ncbi:MAG: hypothetical protein M3295_09310 [Chloroflexota bacterium]|nr:hypothetical protein [Chloroflexota bacterium]
MSVDEDGNVVPRPVIGWHATPVAGRRVFRLTYRSAKHTGAGRVGVELTGDHPVLTPNGYVAAEKLKPGQQIATGCALSSVAHDVVCGTLLGDGSVRANSASLTFGHSQRQVAYARFKAELLAELEPRVDERMVAAVAGGPPAYPVVHVRTLANRALGVLRSDFYQPQKVVPNWLVDRLNERMVAIWFMDDGYTRIRPDRKPIAEIATVSFDDYGVQALLLGLARLGLPAKAARGRIYFDTAATETLSEKIAPFVPASMRYKLHPDVAARVPFDPERLRIGPPRVLFDGVELEEVTHRPRADSTFFCIDVEDTHNFITAGGIVHNCRPPGNRDPHPEEIDACQDYLLRQIELIEPRVVSTLGNFSTKLLRADLTGITRLHGQPEVRTIGPRAVRLYPLFHPAAALYTPRMLETLREDFSCLPELLALPAPEQPDELDDLELAVPEPELAAEPLATESEPQREQLGLF